MNLDADDKWGRGSDPEFERQATDAHADQPVVVMISRERIQQNLGLRIIPILVLNALLAPFLPSLFFDDHSLPGGLDTAEWILRVMVFGGAFFLFANPHAKGAWMLFWGGAALYLATWLPPIFFWEQSWAQSLPIFILPYATPLLFFLALAWWARAPWYGALALVFVLIHGAGGVLRHMENHPP